MACKEEGQGIKGLKEPKLRVHEKQDREAKLSCDLHSPATVGR
jgi:hypothetical protein